MVHRHDDNAVGDEADDEDRLGIRNKAVYLFPGQSAVGGDFSILLQKKYKHCNSNSLNLLKFQDQHLLKAYHQSKTLIYEGFSFIPPILRLCSFLFVPQKSVTSPSVIGNFDYPLPIWSLDWHHFFFCLVCSSTLKKMKIVMSNSLKTASIYSRPMSSDSLLSN